MNEIPDALKEAWPLLRQVMDIQVVKIMKERVAAGTNLAETGGIAYACELLLERMDVIMQVDPVAVARPGRPRLQTMSTPNNQ